MLRGRQHLGPREVRDPQAWKVMRGDGWGYPGMNRDPEVHHGVVGHMSWKRSQILQLRKKGGASGVLALKATCSVCKAVSSRAWLVSKSRAWHLCWGLLRSTYCEIKWDGIPKEPRDWTICAQQVLASELCAVYLLCYFCCGPKLGKGRGKAVRRSLYLCDIKCPVQTRGVWVLNYKGVICWCLSCIAERMLFVETELLSSKAMKYFHPLQTSAGPCKWALLYFCVVCRYPHAGGFLTVHFQMRPGAGNSLPAQGRANNAARWKNKERFYWQITQVSLKCLGFFCLFVFKSKVYLWKVKIHLHCLGGSTSFRLCLL